MNYWLMKSEPDVYSIDDLKRDKVTPWEGVRNYQARNNMRDLIKKGDLVLYYHSRLQPMGIAGIGIVNREAYPDFTAWDKKSNYYDPKTDKNNPRWVMVDVAFKEKFKNLVTLEEVKEIPVLKSMVLLNNTRLSVQPVDKKHFDIIYKLGKN